MTLFQQIKNHIFKAFFYLLPKNGISRLMGKLVSIRFPQWLVQKQIRWFANWFLIDQEDMQKPIEEFDSLQAFFIREMKKERRPIDGEAQSIVSPCDGAYGQSGQITEGQLLQIKGKPYSLSSLLANPDLEKQYEGGSYATFYLSPRDYHRFHAPFSSKINAASYLPGYLWPVNPWAVANVDQLFCVNERVVIELRDQSGKVPAAVMIPVGATMVGKIRVKFDHELMTNSASAKRFDRCYQDQVFMKGEELGLFEFGSTIVLILHPHFGSLKPASLNTKIKMGEPIGKIF